MVRDIAAEIDDERSLDEIAESIWEVYVNYNRAFQKPRATEYLSYKEARGATIAASRLVDWSNFVLAYGFSEDSEANLDDILAEEV